MVRLLKIGFTFAMLSTFASQTYAAKIAGSCSMSETNFEVAGKNLDQLMPIASVSKVYTSLMAVTKYNLDFKFSTYAYVTAVSAGVYDVHIQGSGDPYFNKYKMHMLISKLNEMKVVKIRNLTFDENVKFLIETDKKFNLGSVTINPLVLKAHLDFPTPQLVKSEFTQLKQILKSYPETYALAKANGIGMFRFADLKISNIAFKPAADFKLPDRTEKIFVSSQNFQTILKSMNWNSNNFAANRIFVDSGSLQRFEKLYYTDFKQTKNDVEFVNGSGQNHDLTGNGRLYNEATCRNTVRTLHILNKAVQAQKHQLQDIMSVVGVDVGSTVGGKVYKSTNTDGAVIAKSGTVGTNVALAGYAHTKTGNYYFMINAEVKNASNSEAARARTLIALELQKLVKSKGGPIKIAYKRQNPLNDNLESYEDETADVDAELIKESETN